MILDMKKLTLIFIAVLGLGLMFSCEKKEATPVYDPSQSTASTISEPAADAQFVLTEETADSIMTTFKWTAATFNLDDLEAASYSIQIDMPDSNFVNAKELASTTETMYAITVSAMNKALINLGYEAGVASAVEVRVLSFLPSNRNVSEKASPVIQLTVTPFETIIETKVIYLLGSGTTVGWSNTDALPLTDLGEAKYAIVEHLTPGADQFIKFISNLGQWAPQWGTDATGTPEAGPLVYRPDETVPDPVAIPVGAEEGNYYIVADTINLTYETILTSGELFLVGDATIAGWDNANGVPFIQDAANPTLFTLTTNLTAGDGMGMKLLEVSGAWAPQWGTNEDGTGETGRLVYRPTESVPDPPLIPAPAQSGSYLIEVNLQTLTYTITAQ